MSKIDAVVQRFPDRELEIHRLCVQDQEFQSICEDYADALAALGHWRAQGASAAARADEYRHLTEEFAAEILGLLDSKGCRRHPRDG